MHAHQQAGAGPGATAVRRTLARLCRRPRRPWICARRWGLLRLAALPGCLQGSQPGPAPLPRPQCCAGSLVCARCDRTRSCWCAPASEQRGQAAWPGPVGVQRVRGAARTPPRARAPAALLTTAMWLSRLVRKTGLSGQTGSSQARCGVPSHKSSAHPWPLTQVPLPACPAAHRARKGCLAAQALLCMCAHVQSCWACWSCCTRGQGLLTARTADRIDEGMLGGDGSQLQLREAQAALDEVHVGVVQRLRDSRTWCMLPCCTQGPALCQGPPPAGTVSSEAHWYEPAALQVDPGSTSRDLHARQRAHGRDGARLDQDRLWRALRPHAGVSRPQSPCPRAHSPGPLQSRWSRCTAEWLSGRPKSLVSLGFRESADPGPSRT